MCGALSHDVISSVLWPKGNPPKGATFPQDIPWLDWLEENQLLQRASKSAAPNRTPTYVEEHPKEWKSHLMEMVAAGSPEELSRPCVDCGLTAGSFCDYCRAADRIPTEYWARGQHTPLCNTCDDRWNACHFCRKVHLCTPFTRQYRSHCDKSAYSLAL